MGGEDAIHRDPCIGDGTVAWEVYDKKTGESKIAVFTIAGAGRSEVAAPHARPRKSVSGDNLVYCVRRNGDHEIHLNNIATGFDRVIDVVERLSSSPSIEGDKIAWCEHIRKEEFEGIPGQPLMDEKDIRDVYLYNIASGKKRALARRLLSIGRRIAVRDGRLYLHVYRSYPPPGASNLVVPVDLWVW